MRAEAHQPSNRPRSVGVLLAGAIAAAFGAPGYNVALLNAFWFVAVAVIMIVRAARGQ
jgi:hypothetical protein